MALFSLIKKYLLNLLELKKNKIYKNYLIYFVDPLVYKLWCFCDNFLYSKLYHQVCQIYIRLYTFYEDEIREKDSRGYKTLFVLIFHIIISFFLSSMTRIIYFIIWIIQFLIEILLAGFINTLKKNKWKTSLKQWLLGIIIIKIFSYFSIPFSWGILIFFIFILIKTWNFVFENDGFLSDRDDPQKSKRINRLINLIERISIYFDQKSYLFKEKIAGYCAFDYESFNDKLFYWSEEYPVDEFFLIVENRILRRTILNKIKIW